MDISQIESRGLYSPPNGNQPQALPDLWRPSPDKDVRTDLPYLSNEELNAIGWKGPIEIPPFEGTSYYTHFYEWNSQTRSFDVIELDEFQKQKNVNYQLFWDSLLNTSAYSTIKENASESLLTNTISTEFIALLGDAKRGYANIKKIQEKLTEIVSNISFTEEELAEIQDLFIKTGMFAVYQI